MTASPTGHSLAVSMHLPVAVVGIPRSALIAPLPFDLARAGEGGGPVETPVTSRARDDGMRRFSWIRRAARPRERQNGHGGDQSISARQTTTSVTRTAGADPAADPGRTGAGHRAGPPPAAAMGIRAAGWAQCSWPIGQASRNSPPCRTAWPWPDVRHRPDTARPRTPSALRPTAGTPDSRATSRPACGGRPDAGAEKLRSRPPASCCWATVSRCPKRRSQPAAVAAAHRNRRRRQDCCAGPSPSAFAIYSRLLPRAETRLRHGAVSLVLGTSPPPMLIC